MGTMQKTAYIAAAIAAAALVGAVALDQTRAFCITEACADEVEKELRLAEQRRQAAALEKSVEVEKASLRDAGRRINDIIAQQHEARTKTLASIRSGAQQRISDLSMREREETMNFAGIQPYLGVSSEAFQATYAHQERVRALRVQRIEENKKVIATDTSSFLGVPSLIRCKWGEEKCAKALKEAVEVWNFTDETALEMMSLSGLENNEELKLIRSQQSEAIDLIKSLQISVIESEEMICKAEARDDC